MAELQRTGLPRPQEHLGPRAYAGVVFASHEQLVPGLSRLTDEEFRTQLDSEAPPAEVPWLGACAADGAVSSGRVRQ